MTRLSDMRPGQAGTVVAIHSEHAARLERLSVLGIVPGFPVTVVQRHPAFVLRVGFTELAVDREVAEEIWLTV
jgi:Fe2+ transport system protein FeoA